LNKGVQPLHGIYTTAMMMFLTGFPEAGGGLLLPWAPQPRANNGQGNAQHVLSAKARLQW